MKNDMHQPIIKENEVNNTYYELFLIYIYTENIPIKIKVRTGFSMM
jgi:hypothetical protein